MRVIKSIAASLILALGCLTAAFAQNQREVSGKVLDAAQQPLVGVAVLVEGTNNGTMTSTEDLLKEIMSDPFANVTFSGGDPMFQAEGFAELARAIRKESSKDIWCFTGYKYENLLKNPAQRALLEQIDVLVDGPFIKALADKDLFFRGSSNQRLINVKKSLATGEVV